MLSTQIWVYCRDTRLPISSGSDTVQQNRENPSSLLLSLGPRARKRGSKREERGAEAENANWSVWKEGWIFANNNSDKLWTSSQNMAWSIKLSRSSNKQRYSLKASKWVIGCVKGVRFTVPVCPKQGEGDMYVKLKKSSKSKQLIKLTNWQTYFSRHYGF